MKEIVKKTFLLGLGAAAMTKQQAEKAVKELVRKNAVSAKEGREMLGKARKHALNEGKRIKSFAQQEAKRMLTEFGGVSKAQVSKVKSTLKTIDRELTSKGKSALRKIMKELSR